MAIRDQSYTRYDGPTHHGQMWATIGWSGFRNCWSFWRTKLVLVAIWVLPIVYGLLVIAEAALLGSDHEVYVGVGFFLQIQFFALGLLFIARGCNLVADDMRHQTVQLYFSKPITRFDYAAGKVTTLLLLAFIGVFLPALLIAGLRTALHVQSDAFSELAVVHLQALTLLALIMAMAAALVVGISSLTERAGYAVLIWLGLLLVPMIIQLIVYVATGGSDWASLISINGIIGLATDAWIAGDSGDVPRILPFIAIFALTGAGLGALRMRLTQMEGIT